MTKTELLRLLRLLSALESWAFAQGKTLPDYIHEQLGDSMAVVEHEILRETP